MRIVRWAASAFLPVCLALGAEASGRFTPDADRFLAHVKYLASDSLRGRGTGSPELEKAAQYLAGVYRSLGLEPAFGKSFLQPFTVTMNARLGSKNRLADSLQKAKYRPGEDFVPFNFSASGRVSAPVVFAGYGITAPEYHYDDYAGLDVAGKIVLVLRFEPQEYDDKSIFQGRVYTRHAQFDAKVVNAKLHGARGVILLNNPITHAADAGTLEKFGRTAGPSDAGIPFIQVKPDIAEQWLKASGANLREIVEGIDRDLKPRSFPLSERVKVDLEADVLREQRVVHNVAAILRGQTDEYLVIGAHYDHLGVGEFGSLAPSQVGQIHPGADDNASGVAGVLELASLFRQQRPRRGIVFVNFAAEEIGLLGSAYFVDHPPVALDRCIAMINMDMIGRMKDNSLILGGVATGSGFREIVDAEAALVPHLKIESAEQAGIGSSDHSSFTVKKVPVLFFFTGLHGDYHRPTDTWDKINSKAAADLLALVGGVARRLVEGERVAYRRLSSEATATPGGGSASSGYGPSFGSVPDMTFAGKGVRFSDVRDSSPAAKAGLRAGDVMIQFDGKTIENLYDFTYALRGKNAGDRVLVKIVRGGVEQQVEVLLESRR